MKMFDPTLNFYPLRRRGERVWINIMTPNKNGHLQVIDMPKMMRHAYHKSGICYQRNTFWGRKTETLKFDYVFFVGHRYYLRIAVLSTGKGGLTYSELPEGYQLADLIQPDVLERISEIIKMPVSCIQNKNGTWLIVDVAHKEIAG